MKLLIEFISIVFLSCVTTESYAQNKNLAFLSAANGLISMSIPSKWVKIDQKYSSATDSFVFQVPNEADTGTPESTNVVITVRRLSKGGNLQTFGDAIKTSMSRMEKVIVVSDSGGDNGRRVLLASGKQNDVPYVLTSHLAVCGGYGIDIFLAYPLLKNSREGWEQSLLDDFNRIPKEITFDSKRCIPIPNK